MKRLGVVGLVLILLVFLMPVLPAYANPDEAYWVGGSGNWSDNATHWAATSNGMSGAPLPGAGTKVHFDVASFNATGQTVTADVNGICLSMNWTGVLHNPTLAMANTIESKGDITLVGMTVSGGSYLISSGTTTLATNGITIPALLVGTGSNITLQDDLICGNLLQVSAGTFSTNNKNASTGIFWVEGANAKTVNLGSSIVSCSAVDGWRVDTPASLTLNAGTSSIRITGTGTFAGSGKTYSEVQLNGTAHTVSGNNTFATLALPAGNTQTITFTDTSNQTVTTAILSGSLGHYHTLQGTGAAGWAITKTAGVVNADYINITRSNAVGGATFNANGASVNSGSNTGWNFPLTVTTSGASNIGMGGAGTYATLNGVLTNMGGVVPNTVSFEWGYGTGYGNTVGTTITSVPGSFATTITGFDPNQTVHYRFNTLSGATTANGADSSFSIGSSAPSAPSFVAFNFANGVVPVLFVAFIIFVVMMLALGGAVSPLFAIILMGVAILMGMAFLQGIQALLNAMWGG